MLPVARLPLKDVPTGWEVAVLSPLSVAWFTEARLLPLQAPSKRPSRHESAEHHRIYLPLAPGGSSQHTEADSDCCIRTPQSKERTQATPGRLLITHGEYQDKVQEVSAQRASCHAWMPMYQATRVSQFSIEG
jgi:hypothetical protein